MQNNLSDLNNHLFAQLELLENGELSEKELDLELKKSKSNHTNLFPNIERCKAPDCGHQYG